MCCGEIYIAMEKSKKAWLLQEFSVPSAPLSSIALGKKSSCVMATGSEDGVVNLWSLSNRNNIFKFIAHSSPVDVLCLNETEDTLCTGSHSGNLKIWDMQTGTDRRNLSGHMKSVRCLDFHSYAEFLASGAVDNKIKIWDIRRKGCIYTYTGHQGCINTVKFSPDGRWLASCSEDCTFRIWDITAGKMIHQFRDHNASITCLQYHPYEFFIVTGSKDRTIKVYDVNQFRLISSSSPQANTIFKVLFSYTGRYIYSISHDMCNVHLWEPKHSVTDSVIVEWGQPTDVTISEKHIISGTFDQKNVRNYVIELDMLNSSLVKFPPKLEHPHVPPNDFTSDGQTIVEPQPSLYNVVTLKNNTGSINISSQNSKSQSMQSDTGNNPSFVTIQNEPVQMFNDCENIFEPPSSSSRFSYNREILNWNKLEVPEKDSAFRTPSSTIISRNKGTACDIKSSIGYQDETDQIIPEKLVTTEPTGSFDQSPIFPPVLLSKTPSQSRITSQCRDSLGLNTNAFLPLKKEAVVKECESLTDDQAVELINRGIESMKIVFTARYKNLEIVRALWNSNDVMNSMNTAVRMKDQALLVDLLSVLNLKGSMWTLDLCQILLPEICDLMGSKYEAYVTTACTSLKLVLHSFSPVIQANISTPPTSPVDISREERYKKCSKCYEYLTEIRNSVQKLLLHSGKFGNHFSELSIMLSSFE